MGTSGNVFEILLVREGPPLSFFFLLEGNTMEHGRGLRQDPLSSSIPTPRLNLGLGSLNPLYRDIRSRNCILENSLNQWSFKSWKVSFKTEVCAKSVFPQITMHWIKEVDFAKSTDDLMTPQSIAGRRDFPDFEMLDAKIESALKASHDFQRNISVEEHRARPKRHGANLPCSQTETSSLLAPNASLCAKVLF